MQINEIKEIIKGVAKLAKTVVYSGNITDEVAKRNISEAKDIMREFINMMLEIILEMIILSCLKNVLIKYPHMLIIVLVK